MCFRPNVAEKKEKICAKCKKVNEPAATVCAACGESLAVAPVPGGAPRPPAGGPPAPPKAPPAPPKAPPAPPKAPTPDKE